MNKPFDPDKPCQTRDGRKARIICKDRRHQQYPIVALLEAGGVESQTSHTKDGWLYDAGQSSPHDLINIPERMEGWVNIYAYTVGDLHKTKELADATAGSNRRIACLHLSFTEGEGL